MGPPPSLDAAAIPSLRHCLYTPRRLYILCWSELSRRKLSPTLATPTTLVLTTLVAQCELSRRKIGLLLEVVGRKFSHSPGNPATVGVVRWPAAGDTAGSSLRRLSLLQHRIYNLLGTHPRHATAIHSDVCEEYGHLGVLVERVGDGVRQTQTDERHAHGDQHQSQLALGRPTTMSPAASSAALRLCSAAHGARAGGTEVRRSTDELDALVRRRER